MKKLFAAANRRPVCYLRRMIAGIALLLGMVPAHAQFFGPVAVYSGGGSIGSPCVAVGDLNGDSRPDVVLLNNNPDAVGVLLGNGSGGLGTVTTYAIGTGSSPNWVALGDVNNDGKLDMVTANRGSSTVGVLLGTGAGAFGTATTYSTGPGSTPWGVALGDVNNDGKLDVLTANQGSNAIGVLLGTGTGSLGAVTTISLGIGTIPLNVALADVDTDGFLDAVTLNIGNFGVGVLRGTGTGTFGAMTSYSAGPDITTNGLTLADVNADGKTDVALANNLNNTVDILLNSGTGTFGAVTSYGIGAGTNPQSVAVGDINGDGNPELVTANPTNRTVGVVQGTGPGTFGSVMAYSTGSGSLPNEVRLADLNGDGRLDIVTNNGSSNVGVLLNQPVLASITSFAPTTSRVGGTVTVTGTGLGSATGITVNGVAGTIVGTPTATSLTFVVGPGSSTGLIRVTTGSGPAVSSTSLIIVPAPVLTGSSPPSGATGTVLSMTGLDLQNISSVTFTGVGGTFTAAAGYVVDATGTQLTGLVVPSGLQPGNATFTVTTTGGVSNALNFLVTSAPVITSLSPTSGSVGTSVTITGTNLSGATSVRFNGILVPSASFTSNLATAIVVNVPAGTTTGLVTVTTPAGTSNGLLFTIAAPQLAVMQGSILYPNGGTGYNFGVQAVNTTSTAVGFALNNAGTAAVTISSITTTGDFAMSGAVPAGVAAGGAAPIVVTFTPTAAGPRTGTVVITSSLGIYILNLSGNGQVAAAPVITTLSPNTGTVGGSITIMGTNLGGVTSVSFNGGTALLIANNTSTSLAVVVPAGTITGPVTVTTPAGTSNGLLFTIAAPQLTVMQGSTFYPSGGTGYNFGIQAVSNASAAVSFTLNNPGTAALTISGITTTGDFAVSGTVPTSVAAGGTVAVAVTFTPTATGTRTGTLVITSSLGTYTVNLSGNGQVIAPVITALSPNVGTAGTIVTITGTNLYRTTSVSFNGGTAILIVNNTSTSLTINVPAGAVTGLVTVTTTNGTSNGLLFTIATPQLVVTQGGIIYPSGGMSYFFFNQGLNTTSAAAGFTLNNPGTAALTISGITTTGDFAVSGAVPTSVAAGGTAPVAVTFTPTATGTRTGTLVITSSLGTYTVNLNGNGQAGAPTLISLSPASGLAGSTLALTGTNLTGTTAVYFLRGSAIPVTSGYTVVSAGSITGVVVPVGLGSGTYTVYVGTPGGTSNALVFTVTAPAPILSSLSPTSGAVGDIITLTGSNLAGATSVSFNGVSQPVIIANTGNTLQVPVPPGASTGLVTVTTPGGTSAGLPFTLLVDLTISTGTTATPVVIAANTYRNILITPTGVASLGTGVSVAGGLTVQANGILYTACEAVTGTGSFLLQDGATLGICDVNGLQATGNSGAVRVTGVRFFSTAANYVYNGTAAQSTGSGLPATVRSFTTTNNSLVTLTQPVSISQTLTVAGSGNLDLNGQALRLLSDASGTALVVNAGTGIVTGNTASMERYIMPAGGFLGPGYHHYSAPVTGCTVANLATPGFTPVVNAAFNTSANPLYVAPFPAVFGYDQGRLSTTTNNLDLFSKGWVSPLAPSAVLTVGQGYSVHLPATAKVTFTGTLNTGTYNYTLLRDLSPAVTAEAGWQLLGNPYPAPLDYSLLNAADRSNLDAAIYVYAATNSYAGNYLTYVNGMGSVNPLLAAGQGFFARVSAGLGSGTLRFRNAHRVTTFTTQAAFQRGTADARPRLRLTLQAATGPGPADDLYLYTEAGATVARDAEYDAVKLPNPTGLNLSANATTGEALAIDGLPVLGTGATVVPLTLGLPTAGQYVLAVGELLHFAPGTVITLHDGLTGTATPLTATTSYAFSSATTVVAGRFWLGLRPAATPLATSAELRAEAVAVFPNPAARQATVLVPGLAGAATLHLKLLNALGQVVQTQNPPLPASGALLPLDVAGLARGVYTLRLVAGAASVTRKLVLE